MAEPFIGEIRLFGFNFNPRGWLFCNGALLPIASQSMLFSLYGTTYGGDGRTTFALPDLRGRVAMSNGRHPGSNYSWRMGQKAGAETHALTVSELANHSHAATFTSSGGADGVTVTLSATTEIGDNTTPSAGACLAAAKPPGDGVDKPEQIYKASPATNSLVQLGGVQVSGSAGGGGTVAVGTTGNGSQFSLFQPTLVLNYCVALVGLYPSRS